MEMETMPYCGSTQLLQVPGHLNSCPPSPLPSAPTRLTWDPAGQFQLEPVQDKQVLSANQKVMQLFYGLRKASGRQSHVQGSLLVVASGWRARFVSFIV